jgi:hypothetical protein
MMGAPRRSKLTVAVDVALRRMLEADDAANHPQQTNEQWADWQRAAADYWLLLHPELKRFRRGNPTAIPTVANIRARADLINESTHGIPDTWRLMPPSAAKAEYLARVGWFHELMAGMYDPIHSAIARVADDRSAIETLVRFLEADVYCHRSGYAKADAIRALRRPAALEQQIQERLRAVVLGAVDGPDRREFRAYVRLARLVVDAELMAGLHARLASDSSIVARHARWILEGIGARQRQIDAPRDRLIPALLQLLRLAQTGLMPVEDIVSMLEDADSVVQPSNDEATHRALRSLIADIRAIAVGPAMRVAAERFRVDLSAAPREIPEHR